jgi:glutamyl-Q tRNA(Asp) synthetase
MPPHPASAQPVFRFAPSPNGFLHLGHALSALINYDMARASGGRFLLRIEDIDATRCRPEYEAAIYEDLAWLGLTWERPVRRQSEHLDDYAKALQQLHEMALLYESFESRAEMAAQVRAYEQGGRAWPRDPDGAPLYPRPFVHSVSDALHNQRPAARRLRMRSAVERVGPLAWDEQGVGPQGEEGRITAHPEAWGDVVLARKDTPTSYHLAVTLDDALQGITHVVRGQDLFWSTSVHRLLQELLGLPCPTYTHHRLICDANGAKLSKSTLATALRELRASGKTPNDIKRLIGLS